MNYGEVLIVDDSSTSRMIIQRCIEMAGLEVSGFLYAENGLDALKALKEAGGGSPIGVIVTDINMPKMDGATFLRLIKSDPGTQAIPTIVVSSVAAGEADSELLGLGAAAVVKKPVSPAKMHQAFGGLA
jgi:two-component system chemotaxis response regulator CheY